MAACQHCQQTFGRTNSLTRNLREKHGLNQMRIEWRFCTKTFSRAEHYRRHLQTQNDQTFTSRTYPCPVCPKQDLQAPRPPTTPPANLPCPTKGRRSKRVVGGRIFPASRKQRSKRTVCDGPFPAHRTSRLRRNVSYQRTSIKSSPLRRNFSCQHKASIKTNRLRRTFSWQEQNLLN